MRVATFQWQIQWLANYLQQRQSVDRLQQQVSSGRRILEPADDPAASARIAELGPALDSATQFTENASAVRGRLESEDGLLARAGDILQRVRELTVQSASATTTPEAQRSIASELRQDLAALLDVANFRDARGEYVFAGTRSAVRPFSVAAGAVAYAGDTMQRSVRVGQGQLLADGDTGSRIFDTVRNGTGTFVARAGGANAGTLIVGARVLADPSAWDGGDYVVSFAAPDSYEVRDSAGALVQGGAYAAGDSISFRGVALALSGTPAAGDTLTVGPSVAQSAFTTIQRLAAALESAGSGAAARSAIANVAGDSLDDLDRALERIGEVRADVGARLQAADRASDVLGDTSLALTKEISGLRDVDLAATLSALSNQLTGLDAAQQTFTKLQSLSLFNYLR